MNRAAQAEAEAVEQVLTAITATRAGQPLPDGLITAVVNSYVALMLRVGRPKLDADADADADAVEVRAAIESGRALRTLHAWVKAQHGDTSQVDNPDALPRARHTEVVRAAGVGYVRAVDAKAVGAVAVRLGAGRMTRDAAIDHAAGIVLRARVGSVVRAGDVIAELHWNTGNAHAVLGAVSSAFMLGADMPDVAPVVNAVIGEVAG